MADIFTNGKSHKKSRGAKKAQIVTAERVRDFGEVYTNEREVKAMCDLLPREIWENIGATFLEPSCGNGNFLVEILARKLAICKTEEDAKRALKSITGIDILADNVRASKERMFAMVQAKFPTINKAAAMRILNKQIICGDSLKIMKEWENEQ